VAAPALACPGGGFSVPERKAGGELSRRGDGESGGNMNWKQTARRRAEVAGWIAA